MEETAHLLSTSANTKRLTESIAQDKAGNTTMRELNLDEAKSKMAVRKRAVKAKSR